ncbi:MAG: tRNA uridine-5-carboxymethylaminomethyl(34) synthesis enzyme MnmG [Candidatus Omnitrophota bacterium]
MDTYDVVVVGAGHAGIEAALAASRMGQSTLLVTLSAETIGQMSCNPAIGGVGKGQLVKEIDALGGEMARAADSSGLQFRILNASKGAAVQSSRCQIDRKLYKNYMRAAVSSQHNLKVKEAHVRSLIVEDGSVKGVLTDAAGALESSAVVLAPGTFLNGVIHVGLKHFSAGRIDEPAAVELSDNLKRLGFRLLRFKTGTCPRLDKDTIDFSRLAAQEGDNPPKPFSFSTREIKQRQIPCYITYTNENTHRLILDNLDRSPLYTGVIQATGVRYCPSIEDKVVKFKERARHQVFLEPEGYDAREVYPNGLATSLPEDVQLEMLHSIEGLEDAKVLKFGYGIEHTVVDPLQLYPSLQTKLIKNLYLAGQINGTTGYEEAAAQGLIAGINAALSSKGKEPLVLDRSSGYIGVLIDDLTTKGTNEPYRMFTSRVEYRLILREDNADLRLRKIGYGVGLVDSWTYRQTEEKSRSIEEGIAFLKEKRIGFGSGINDILKKQATPPLKKAVSLEELLRRPEVSIEDLRGVGLLGNIPESIGREMEIEVKYSGFIQRQLAEVERFRNLERIRLPAELDYNLLSGLSREIREKLKSSKPINLGQASRISGVTPAAVAILMVYLRKLNEQRQKLQRP